MERRGTFDYILLETTGLADPGNIAPLFWLDDGLGSSIYLDGVVTLVDAKNILRSLDDPAEIRAALTEDAHPETDGPSSGLGRQPSKLELDHEHAGPHLTTAHLQISYADVIVINKADLVDSSQLEIVQSRIKSINGIARVHVTTKSQVPRLEGTLLDLHAYESVANIDTFTRRAHSHLDPSISTITLRVPMLMSHEVDVFDKWLQNVCWESILPGASTDPFEVHRIKGRVLVTDGRVLILQGVREIYALGHETGTIDASGESGAGKIVVIGRGLDVEQWRESLGAAVGRRVLIG